MVRRVYTDEENQRYYAGLYRVAMSACVLITDEDDRVLLVKPSYRDWWLLPGGVVDEGEKPYACAVREAREEVGLTLQVGRLLVVDQRSAASSHPASTMFVFDGGRLTEDRHAEVRIDGEEIEAWTWATLDEACALTNQSSGARHRFRAAWEARAAGGAVYLEDGQPPS